MMNWREWLRKVDFLFLGTALSLVFLGLLILYSLASVDQADATFAKKQLLWTSVGLAIMTLTAFFNYNRWRHYVPIIYGLSVLFLLVGSIIGRTALGAQRWIDIGPLTFQPSEFSKFALIITLSGFLADRKGVLDGWRDVVLAILHAAPPVVLIMLQPDLGTALVLLAILSGILLAAGIGGRQILSLGLAAYVAGALTVKLKLLHAYQMQRLTVFLNPEVDPLGSGYNLRQSIIAIGSGGLTGKGLFSGTQSRLDFLPAAVRHTDFIFAVLGEELGFLGGVIFVALAFMLLSRTLKIATLSKNHFGLLVASGFASMWTFQVLVNVGMTIGIMPVTGIPLPFVSYGGSSMMMNLAAVGVLLNIYSRRWQ